jgi:hypothetical protein
MAAAPHCGQTIGPTAGALAGTVAVALAVEGMSAVPH